MDQLTETPRVTTAPPKDLRGRLERIALFGTIIIPLIALCLAIPAAWGGWLGWRDATIAIVFYLVSGLGITVGYHRYFTHSSFKANRALRIALGIAGSLAIQGAVIRWVADHRKHHAFSDAEGDPHSPWRYGNTVGALLKGMLYAHVGWLFESDKAPIDKYAPDLRDDPDIAEISRRFPQLALFSFVGPAVIGGLLSWSFAGALTAFFWASLVRIALLHHVTWSINSICHTIGERPFNSRDKSSNVWWLALLSFGESWHNLHHADPTCARHGALRGQLDPSARVIRWFEQLGWAWEVRWPKPERLAKRMLLDKRLAA